MRQCGFRALICIDLGGRDREIAQTLFQGRLAGITAKIGPLQADRQDALLGNHVEGGQRVPRPALGAVLRRRDGDTR